MAKLYPPDIGGTIPAFYKNNLNQLTIPFMMNKTVSKNQVKGFNLIIKTVANSKLIGNLRVTTSGDYLPPWNFTKGEVYFTIPEGDNLWNELYIGQYYKVQLAYIDNEGEIGYYSSTGIIKFTTEPDIAIEDLTYGKVSINQTFYVGTYSQNRKADGSARDISEKVYSYCFYVYDADGNLVDTSGEQVHNSFEDENAYSSRDTFTLNKELEVNKNYYIQYEVTTSNNAHFKSPKYRIMDKETIDPEIRATVQVDLNRNNGYVNVRLVGEKDPYGNEYAASGSFALKRGCSKDNYTAWDTILTFRLNGQQPSRWLWRDMTVEHGYYYKYALQQFNDEGLYSNKLYSNELYVTFEDAFLYDGQRQLKLRFNPKVTSFKDTVLETKTNTIGSKYPFIFRNNAVDYKEFPISGLVSYWMDDEELFITKNELFLEEQTTNLTDNNVAAERIFKLAVLDFFNNGQPKLFRSPAEGNYIVRLLNVSMTPTDSVSRMLHTITAQASEVSEFSYNALLDYGFVELQDTQYPITRWETVLMVEEDDFGVPHYRADNEELLNYSPATSLHFENIVPGTKFRLTNEYGEVDEIIIGQTGTYIIDLPDMNFVSVRTCLAGGQRIEQGSLIYSYESNASNVFDTISQIEIHDYPLIQYIGEHEDLVAEINNSKFTLLDFTYLRFTKRYVQRIYVPSNSVTSSIYYWDMDCNTRIYREEFEDTYMYEVVKPGTTIPLYYLDGRNPYYDQRYNYSATNYRASEYKNAFVLNGETIDLTETEVYEIKHPENVTSLSMSVGLSLECAYQVKETIYSLESTNQAVQQAKQNYENALNNYLTLRNWEEVDGVYYQNNGPGVDCYTGTYINALNTAYTRLTAKDQNGLTLFDKYLSILDAAVEKQKEDNAFYE